MKTARYLIILITLLLSGIACRGQYIKKKAPEALRYSIEEGLSQNRITTTFTDQRGFLWVGTIDGLNRFDGYDFRIYRYVPMDSSSLSSDYIRCITEDSFGNLWIGTNRGLNLYQPGKDNFRNVLFSDEKLVNRETDIRAMHASPSGLLWILTNEDLLCYQPEKNKLNSIKLPYLLPGASYDIDLIFDRKGLLWFGTERGLLAFDRVQGRFHHYKMDAGDSLTLPDNQIHAVFEDSDGELWVGTEKGLNKYDRLMDRFMRFAKLSEPGEEFEISSIAEDMDGRIWLGGKNGLAYFRKRNGKLSLVPELKLVNSDGQLGSIRSLSCDSTNILWLGSVNGLYKVDLKPRKFELYDDSGYSFKRLSHTDITAVLKNNSVQLWVGYNNHGLDKIDVKTGELTNLNTANGLRNNKIRSLYLDSEKRMWIGTRKGIDLIYPGSDEIFSFEEVFRTIPENILREKEILCFLEAPEGIFWIGTEDGMFVFREHLRIVNNFQEFFNAKERIRPGKVYDIIGDTMNCIWIGTENGLIKYDCTNDKFQKINPSKGNSWIVDSPVFSLLYGSDENIWMGTSFGLACYNSQTDHLTHFSTEQGMSAPHVYAILEDIETNVWLSTNKGISRFSRETGEFRNFSLREGLQGYEYNRGASFVSFDGELFFGGRSGLNSFYPDQLSNNSASPHTEITGLVISNQEDSRSVAGVDEKSILQVQYDESFTIRFSTLDFTSPSNNQYKYSLQQKGKPEKWISLGDQNTLTISNLPSGEYIFKVKGANHEGIWSHSAVDLKILVAIPFWKSRMAIIIYVVVLGVLFYLIIQYRTQSLRKSNKILKEREQAGKEIERQKELLSRRNKNIEDSLKYANKIQSAMLNTQDQFRKIIPESFILHKPKDIVSGDFYWISEEDGKIFVAAIDCTGHGVPGAFMSIIGFELFRKIIHMQKICDPGQILEALNENFQEIFSTGNDISLRDGMDLSFCVIDKKEMVLNYAGAFNPLYLIRSNKLIEVRGDRFSVGADNDSLEGRNSKKFTSNKMKLNKDDMIYLFSDGYADQFGGPEGKKYKYRRFRHLLLTIHHLPLDRQKTYLWESIEEWRGNFEQIDDILVIGIKPKF